MSVSVHTVLFVSMFLLVLLVELTWTFDDGARTLYKDADSISQLDGVTFDTHIYNRTKAFFVEFYSSWCGACISYAAKFKQLASAVESWRNVVEIAALNCADMKNSQICRKHQIDGFPTLKYFKYDSKNEDDGQIFDGDRGDVQKLPFEIAKFVENDWLEQKPPNWPHLEFFDSSTSTTDLWLRRKSANSLILIFESESTKIAWALTLSYFHTKSLAIFVGSRSHPISDSLQVDVTSKSEPFVVIFKDTQAVPQLITDRLDDFSALIAEIRQNLHLKTQQIVHSNANNLTIAPKMSAKVDQFQVQLVDLKSTLSYMIYHEIPRRQIIDGDQLAVLTSFIHLMAQYVPGTNPVRRLFHRLDQWLVLQNISISADQWLSTVEIIQVLAVVFLGDDLGHPLPANVTWIACQGSKPFFRGYTCGLWTLFHAVTVLAYKKVGRDRQFVPSDVLQPIQQFVFNYLSCIECADNFRRLVASDKLSIPSDGKDVVLWLWKAHNNVNERLAGSNSEDPLFPKKQFPVEGLCSRCKIERRWNENAVFHFLLDYYSNIRTDPPLMTNNYLVTSFLDGRASIPKRRSLDVNPKFAVIGAAVGQFSGAISNGRWSRSRPNLNSTPDWISPTFDLDFCVLLWTVSMLAIILLLVYVKFYRKNRGKFWKTFYHYTHADYKL